MGLCKIECNYLKLLSSQVGWRRRSGSCMFCLREGVADQAWFNTWCTPYGMMAKMVVCAPTGISWAQSNSGIALPARPHGALLQPLVQICLFWVLARLLFRPDPHQNSVPRYLTTTLTTFLFTYFLPRRASCRRVSCDQSVEASIYLIFLMLFVF